MITYYGFFREIKKMPYILNLVLYGVYLVVVNSGQFSDDHVLPQQLIIFSFHL